MEIPDHHPVFHVPGNPNRRHRWKYFADPAPEWLFVNAADQLVEAFRVAAGTNHATDPNEPNDPCDDLPPPPLSPALA